MGFNYGLEKKNFDSQWAVTRKQYEDAGMSSEAIQAMYDYDWSVFNATRAYQNHTQEIAAPSFEQSEESYSPLMNKYQEAISVTDHYCETNSRFAWIGEIEDENLLSALEKLSDEDTSTETRCLGGAVGFLHIQTEVSQFGIYFEIPTRRHLLRST